MSTRKVSFFHLSLSMDIDGTSVPIRQQNVETYFQSIYSDIKSIPTESAQEIHAKRLQIDKNDIVVEVIQYDKTNRSASLKIGYLNPTTITDLRDHDTLQTEEIKLSDTQKVETYTCCYINFTTNIVSYINVISAPRISALELFFNECLKEHGITGTLSAIFCPTDELDLECTRVTKVEIAFAVPKQEKLSEDLGLSQKLFEKFFNVQTFNTTYTISAERNQTLFNNTDDFLAFKKIMKNSKKHQPTKVKATIKTGKNAPQIVDLLLERYTYSDSITLDENQSLDHKDTLNDLVTCYTESVGKLIPYIPEEPQKEG